MSTTRRLRLNRSNLAIRSRAPWSLAEAIAASGCGRSARLSGSTSTNSGSSSYALAGGGDPEVGNVLHQSTMNKTEGGRGLNTCPDTSYFRVDLLHLTGDFFRADLGYKLQFDMVKRPQWRTMYIRRSIQRDGR